MTLAGENAGDITKVYRGGRCRGGIEYYNFPCSFDIETTTILPGELDYMGLDSDPPIAFPYLFQFNLYGYVLMCRQYKEALQIFHWIENYFRLGKNRRMVFFIHNLGYEYTFFKDLWDIEYEESFALSEHHPVSLITTTGIFFRDSYKMTNQSLEVLSKDWSPKWKKNKELMDYSELRTPYTKLDENTLIYSALDVLSLSDAILPFLQARGENIWSRCPTSTSFIRTNLKKRVGVGVKHRTPEQIQYHRILDLQRMEWEVFCLMTRLSRGGNTHMNRAYTGMLLQDVYHGDIKSSYPGQAVNEPEFPLGFWAPMDRGSDIETLELFEANNYCCIADVLLLNPRLKQGITVPYISISKMVIVEGSGMEASDNGRYMGGLDAIQVSIFGVEWPIIKAQYDFDGAIIVNGYFSRKGYLPDIVRNFILELFQKKTELKNVKGKEVEYMLAKIDVNSVFGMAYTNPIRPRAKIGDDGIHVEELEDPAAELEKFQRSIGYFLPYSWGAMIACLGRVQLQKMIDAVGEDFVYCDTDSVFALNPEKSRAAIQKLDKELSEHRAKCGINITFKDKSGKEHELGSIDEEPVCEYFKSFGAKKYITVENGELTCTIAGVPKTAGAKIIGTPENFQLGMNFKGEETGKNCLWYNDDPQMLLHDEQGREIEIHSNVAMMPVDYLLSISPDYMECLSIEGNFHWKFNEGDSNGINFEDY